MQNCLTLLCLLAFLTTAVAQKNTAVYTGGISASYRHKMLDIGTTFPTAENVFQPRLHVGRTVGDRWEVGLFVGYVVHSLHFEFRETGFAAGGYGRYNFLITPNRKLKLYTGVGAYYERRSFSSSLRFGSQFDPTSSFLFTPLPSTRFYTGDMAIYAHLGLQYFPAPNFSLFTEFGRIGHMYTRRSNTLTDEVFREYSGLNPFDLKGLRLGVQWYFRKK